MPEPYLDPKAPVQSNQYAYEFGALLHIFRRRCPGRILEIGVAEGGTLYQWMKHARSGAQIVAVDLPGAMHGIPGTERWAEQWGRWAEKHRVSFDFQLADSADPVIIDWVRYFAPFDWIFIDGDHRYAGVLADFMNYMPMAAEGGVVVLHDILPHPEMPSVEVDQLWKDIQAAYPTAEIISGPDQPDKGIGIVYV
jgi:predicted O-methyltransferase YrrM